MEAVTFFENYLPLLSSLVAFVVAYRVMPVIIDVSHMKRLFDDPTNARKLHMSSIPNLGGVGIYAAVCTAFLLSGYALQPWSPYLFAGLTILFFSGIKDDILVISPYKKLLLQVVAIIALMGGSNLVITDMGGMFGLHEIPLWAGVTLTFFTMVVVLNAYNLIDGIDGLAGGIGIIASSFFAWWFWEIGMIPHAVLALTLVGALAAFMRYNYQPASIFMGDTGSQIVGFLLAFFAVSFVSSGVAASSVVPFKNAVPVLVLSVLIVPLYDTLRVFLIRLWRGKSPFSADRLHVHHQLIDMGFSHRGSCNILYAFNAAVIGLTMLLSGMEVNLLFGIVLLTTVVLFPTVQIKRKSLRFMGLEMPTKKQIKVLEMKYGMSPKTVGNEQNGHSFSFEDEEIQSEEELEELAV